MGKGARSLAKQVLGKFFWQCSLVGHSLAKEKQVWKEREVEIVVISEFIQRVVIRSSDLDLLVGFPVVGDR